MFFDYADSVIKISVYYLKSDSHLAKMCYLLDWKPFNDDEKKNYFILKALFAHKIFTFKIFRPCRKNGFIRKIMLTSKFMTSQPGLQTVAIHIFPNISRSKDNQTIKFGQVIEYNK